MVSTNVKASHRKVRRGSENIKDKVTKDGRDIVTFLHFVVNFSPLLKMDHF